NAHELGLATILWCYLRNEAFRTEGLDYDSAADLTGQANHLGVTLMADLIKQKLPTINGGYRGCGLIVGRKAFQRPFADGVELLHRVEDVYLDPDINLA